MKDVTGLHAIGLPSERDDHPALELAGLEPQAWVAHLGCTDEVVQRHPVGRRERQEEL